MIKCRKSIERMSQMSKKARAEEIGMPWENIVGVHFIFSWSKAAPDIGNCRRLSNCPLCIFQGQANTCLASGTLGTSTWLHHAKEESMASHGVRFESFSSWCRRCPCWSTRKCDEINSARAYSILRTSVARQWLCGSYSWNQVARVDVHVYKSSTTGLLSAFSMLWSLDLSSLRHCSLSSDYGWQSWVAGRIFSDHIAVMSIVSNAKIRQICTCDSKHA